MSNDSSSISTPHADIGGQNAQQRFALDLFDRLWQRYRERVSHVRSYEQVVADHGGTFVNDHSAFRTFACQRPMVGISSVSRLFEALGYRAAGCYFFADKQLSALHFQHPHPQFPKLFISELWTWELPETVRATIESIVARHRDPIESAVLAALAGMAENEPSEAQYEALLDQALDWIEQLPWTPPEKREVELVNQESQYAAWVLVHGYNVNHFTSLINSHGVESLDDIEKTVAALKAAGVPMKDQIEGERGTKLRQTATAAAVIDVNVLDAGQATTMPWTYAYFELAERGIVRDPETGQETRFEGFLGPQATQLFEMTRLAR